MAASLREPIPSFPDGIQFGSRVSLNWIGEGTLARFYFEVNEIDDMLRAAHGMIRIVVGGRTRPRHLYSYVPIFWFLCK